MGPCRIAKCSGRSIQTDARITPEMASPPLPPLTSLSSLPCRSFSSKFIEFKDLAVLTTQ